MRNGPGGRGALHVVAVVLLAIETLAVATLALGYVVYAAVDQSFSRFGIGLAVVFGLLALGIGLVTRGFARGQRFSFSAAITWQMLQASIAVWIMAKQPLVAALLLGAAAVVGMAALRAARRWYAAADMADGREEQVGS